MKTSSSVIAGFILFLMGVLMVGSSWNDSAVMDELPHIPAGYSYLTQKDYRLNPEHPPLIKMLAAIPLLFQNIRFPADSPHWKDGINGQWDFGQDFLYGSGNNPEQIIFWARIPVMILALVAGWLLFRFTRRSFGTRAALLALSFFAFSPTVIAHSRFVTTDLGATFAFMIGIFSFVLFLQQPTWKHACIAGIAFGVAELLKFSLVLLLPMYAFIFVVYVLSIRIHRAQPLVSLAPIVPKFLAIFVIGAVVIWPAYQYTVWNYPPARQKADTAFTMASFAKGPLSMREACTTLSRLSRCPAEITLWASDKPVIRPYAQYMLGVLMVFQRAAGGNTAYFLGEVSNLGSRAYFPIAYLLKEPVPILILELLALCMALFSIRHIHQWSGRGFAAWIAEHPLELSSLIMIALYWAASMRSPLNIGIRHVMPTFPFIYILTARQIARWLIYAHFEPARTWLRWAATLTAFLFRQTGKYLFVACMLLWLSVETVLIAPSYLSYYNEFAGGTKNGYQYITDSNYDWGQDLKRLAMFAKKNNIKKISLDYFGGGDPRHYLGDAFEPWQSSRGNMHGWFAVSATFRQEAFAKTVPGFVRAPENSYEWLRSHKPVARAGDSIFIYYLP